MVMRGVRWGRVVNRGRGSGGSEGFVGRGCWRGGKVDGMLVEREVGCGCKQARQLSG